MRWRGADAAVHRRALALAAAVALLAGACGAGALATDQTTDRPPDAASAPGPPPGSGPGSGSAPGAGSVVATTPGTVPSPGGDAGGAAATPRSTVSGQRPPGPTPGPAPDRPAPPSARPGPTGAPGPTPTTGAGPGITTPIVGPGAVDTVTTLATPANRVPAGQGITLEATTLVAAGGSVTDPGAQVVFYEGATVIGTATFFFGHYTLLLPPPPVAVHVYRAEFAGAAAFRPSSSASVTVQVDAVLWPAPPAPGDPNFHPQTIPAYRGAGRTLGVVGDSITRHVGEDLATGASTAGFAPAVTGMDGYRLAVTKPWIDRYAASAPQVMIINLGTNDAASEALLDPNFTLDLFRQRMAQVAALFPRTCLVVTTIASHRSLANSDPTHDGYQPAAFNAVAAAYNGYLRSTFANVADWDAVVAVHPEYLKDGVHPKTDEARQALVSTQVAAAQGCT